MKMVTANQIRCITSNWKIKTILFIIFVLLFQFISPSFKTMFNKSSPSVRSRILLSIIIDGQSMTTLVNASQHTWIPLWPYDIIYFIGDKQSRTILSFFSSQQTIIRLQSTDDKYGNVHLIFAAWSYLYDQYANNYDYFLLIDAATYVNVKNTLLMVESMTCTDCYIGQPVRNDQNSNNQPAFICNDMGYVIARGTLLKFGPHIKQCRSSVSSVESDKEIGKCLHRYASGVSCTEAKPLFSHVVNTTDKQRMYPKLKDERNESEFPKAPPTYVFESSLVHPLRKAESFFYFHDQIIHQLRPILHPSFLNGSCVANPFIQEETYPGGNRVRECRLAISNVSIDTKDRKRFGAFVVSLPHTINRTKHLIQAFRQQNVEVEVLMGTSGVKVPDGLRLTMGEWNLRLSMIHLFQRAIDRKYEHILVFDDDAVPHRRFSELFPKVMSDQRCGEAAMNGILLLGSFTFTTVWPKIDANIETEYGLCKNVANLVFGSFAILYPRSIFKPILNWLNGNIDIDAYDFLLTYLPRLGYPTRMTVPNLVISDIRHVSSIRPLLNNEMYDLQKRAPIFRWNLTEYMFKDNFQ